MAYLGYDKETVDAMTGGKREQQQRNRIKPTATQYNVEKQNHEFKQRTKKPHSSCTTPETCVAQNRCRKTGKALVNGKVAK